mgnify:FL=1
MKKKLILSLTMCAIAVILIIILIYLFFEIKYPLKYEDDIRANATKNNLEASFVAAIINTESSFNKDAKSQSGAEGLMQLLPTTAEFVANKFGIEFEDKNLFDASKNIEIGCRYLRYLFDKFGDKRTVLFAYNSGEGNVATWLKIEDYSQDGKTLMTCPYAETNNYVQKVLEAEKYYKKKCP